MRKSTVLLQLFLSVALTGMMVFTAARAEKIIWVSGNIQDPNGVDWDQPFVEVLEANGYEVQRENDTMAGNPLTAEQIGVLESGDLIIVSRSTTSGSYNDPIGWNSVSKPLICTTVYLSRLSRWQWVNSDALLGDGDSGCPPFHAEIPAHPIFAGVNLDGDGNVAALDSTAGSGNTSLHNWTEYGDGELIATTASTGTIAIVYWPKDAVFSPEGEQVAGASRLLFSCGARESTLSPPNPEHGQGMYNLTPEGEKMFLNAVAFMLGKPTGVIENAEAIPVDYSLNQNYPNPFNPSTTLAFTLPSVNVARISVYNMLGQEIVVLAERTFQAGTHEVVWNGRDRFGKPLQSGVYLYQLESGNVIRVKKMLLMK